MSKMNAILYDEIFNSIMAILSDGSKVDENIRESIAAAIMEALRLYDSHQDK